MKINWQMWALAIGQLVLAICLLTVVLHKRQKKQDTCSKCSQKLIQ